MTSRTVATAAVWLCLSMHAIAAEDNPREGPPNPPDTEPKLDVPLLAHWTFNEPADADVIRDRARPPAAHLPAGSAAARTRGVHGGALDLSGSHQLKADLSQKAQELSQITFSAWTRPTDLGRYREIFRQECAERLLFSYQLDGKILSLGLNIGGYVECDAPLEPAHVLDGAWHHTAATFDGRQMRVYFDGREIGSLMRPGTIAFNPAVPAYVGSSSGRGEFFQGSLDDLRIYHQALTPEQVAGLYRSGLSAVAARFAFLEKRITDFYARQKSFAKTLTHARRMLAQAGPRFDPDVGEVLLMKLKADFADDYASYLHLTGTSPLEFLTARSDDPHVGHAARLLELLVEYKPITECQWQRQTPEQLQTWKQAEELQTRFHQLQARGEAARFAPDWIDLVFEAGRRVQFRPSISEAVAPYRTPETPPTRDLTAAEAQETLQRDWLHQAGDNPTPERIVEEIHWARQLAERIAGNFPNRVDLAAELSSLRDGAGKAAELTEFDRELYFQVRRIKRAIALKNPVVDFKKVLFVDMPFPQGKEWPHETRHRLGYMAVPGARLLLLDGLSPAGKLSRLAPQAPLHGSFWRPDLSFDASRVVFCFKPHNEKAFHLYEIGIDGSGLVQLTDGPFDDLDPIYLPDGRHILFSTTRGHTYVRCMPPTNAYVLARCERDGSNIYLTSRNNEPDYLPSVMNDGRVIYTRWEYTDKPLWRAQGLWTVNPDGTQVNTLWGNQTVWPDLLKDARSIPGSRRVMFTGSAHHNWFSGAVGILDPDRGSNFPNGLTKVTADLQWPESGNGPVDPVESARYHASGHYEAYYSPYPLGEQDFLVSANRQGKFVLYLMDVDGNRELIYEGTNQIFHALPVRPRRRPPVIGDRVAWPDRAHRDQPAGGVLYSSNVYFGAPAELKNRAKYLRILNIEPKTYTYWHKRPYISTGPVVSIVQSEGVKRVLGTVRIEDDGSVAFHAPSGTALHFQLLDENYRALQTMRSFTGVMPGEQRGCLGCHEQHSTTPRHDTKSIALSQKPRPITKPPWGEDTVSYLRYVQPVLDRYCGKCHQGEGEARETLDLTLRPGFLMFDEPYVTLTGKPSWGKPHETPENPPPGWGIANMLVVEGYDKLDPAAYRTPRPMTHLSYRSPLVELAASGKHHDVRVDPVSLRKLIAWVDSMCPFRGDEEVRAIADPEFQGVDWLAIRPKIETAPRIIRPGPVDD